MVDAYSTVVSVRLVKRVRRSFICISPAPDGSGIGNESHTVPAGSPCLRVTVNDDGRLRSCYYCLHCYPYHPRIEQFLNTLWREV